MTGVTTSPEVCAQVGQLLLDPKRPLKERWVSSHTVCRTLLGQHYYYVSYVYRFRALFTLKSIGGQEAVDWMAKAFDDESALLKHEVRLFPVDIQELICRLLIVWVNCSLIWHCLS